MRKTKPDTTPFEQLAPATQAGILCGADMFQRFAAERVGLPTNQCTASAAAEYLRQFCGVNSRRELNINPESAARFATLQTEYDAWRGKIPSQR